MKEPLVSPIGEEGTPLLLENFKALAKKGCRFCYGRGYEGIVRATGEVIYCRCAIKNITGGASGT